MAVAATCQPSVAADIRLVGNQIEITGDIVEGDYEKFDRITEQSNWPSNPVVRLRSDGGRVGDAIRIGLTIRQNGYHTYGDKGDCASACALIWLAGTKRFRHPENRMGFHQTYDEETQRAQGNAVVGFYLAQLNLDYDVTLFVTEAAPKRMKWLNEDNAGKVGIRYTTKAISIHDLDPLDAPVPTLRTVPGAMQFADGRSYIGDLDAGRPSGDGVMLWPNGDRYHGEWKAGYESGRGLFAGDDHVYSGAWERGRKHGYGEEHGNWGQYRGDFKRGSWHGHGTLILANGDTYVGYFANGVAQGDGRLQFSGDRLYTGAFHKGLFHGQGRLSVKGVRIYEGQWQAGVPDGTGKFTFGNGDVYAGQWQNGLRHGKGRLTSANGSVNEGRWRNGVKSGVVVHTAPGQPSTEFTYAMGIPQSSSVLREQSSGAAGNESQSEAIVPEPDVPQHRGTQKKQAFSIQLASRKSNGEAERTIKSLTRIYPELFDGRHVFVEKGAAAGNKSVFRIFVAAEDRADAGEFCRAFRNHGRSCLILRN